MSAAATRLRPRVVGSELAFSVGSALLVALLTPYFLLLSGPVAVQGAGALSGGVAAGGFVGSAYAALRLIRYRYVLRALAVGTRAVEAEELHRLSEEPKRLLVGWLLPTGVSIAATTIFLRPVLLDLNTGITLCLLGVVITAAASLPLFVLLRRAILGVLELGPHEAMREVVEEAEHRGLIGQRISRRMLAAVVTPVVCLSLGAALIVNAHVRRADERDREETARVLARAALDASPSVVPRAGLEAAIEGGRALGFDAKRRDVNTDYAVVRGEDGVARLLAPLDSGSAEVRFNGSTVGFLSLSSLVVTLLAAAVAAFLGAEFGATLAHDLRGATRNIRSLGTELVVSGSPSGARIVRSARFQVVVDLGRAIERLAQRFRVFAKAQERAIEARKAAARMRGLFFASVSHDLKSPLNAILGFTQLVRRTAQLTPAQLESLDPIERRGHELLALIETILDAARVEAGQLELVLDPTEVTTLLNEAALKGRDLAAERDAPVVIEAAADLPILWVDRVRMPRALATFIAHALRTTEAPMVRVTASLDGPRRLRISVDLDSSQFSLTRLESMLDPNRDPGVSEHRGFALGLRLARAVTELHGGKVEAKERKGGGGTLSAILPIQRESMPPPSSVR
ncbi:MAG TPA: HAMP domain-containing sensor histidine kinase [Polyangiaceae bacterium]|nr:HAMP domain-containing sensor histidine kinase [Polyangiaceae bacterium]